MLLTSVDQVTTAWLTDCLRTSGSLSAGQVSAVSADTQTFNQGYLSLIAKLTVRYSADAAGSRPEHLFLKLSKPDLHVELLERGRHEIEFYTEVSRAGADLPVPACYAAAYDPATHQSHLLLDDLSATHTQQPLPIPPSNRHCELMVETLAQVHARWWNSPQLGTSLGQRRDPASAEQSLRRLQATLPAFMDHLGDALLPEQRQAYDRIMASSFLPRRAQRLLDQHQVTLIHGDAHAGNMLLPRDTQHGRVSLIDWHLWGIDLACIDLAFLMALHWSPPRRARLEQPLLRRYHDQLRASGVSHYTWDLLWRDYREAVIVMTLIPIGQFRRGSPAGVIWFGLQDSLAAFEDLNCAELL
jgi:aminoglycoside phosphotransferase (APT) family kinase protein